MDDREENARGVMRSERHPHLGDRAISTSELFAIDAQAGWARTFSRFYRLAIHPPR